MRLVKNTICRKRVKFFELDAQIAKMCPTPGPAIQKKFDYFYQAYNYATNTAKYMTFDDNTGLIPLPKPLFENISYSNQHEDPEDNIDVFD